MLVGGALAAAMILVILLVNALLGPRRSSPSKSESFECGNAPAAPDSGRLPVKHYTAALVFLVFHVAVLLLLPLAVAFRGLLAEPAAGLTPLAGLLIFAANLGVALFYVLMRNGLETR